MLLLNKIMIYILLNIFLLKYKLTNYNFDEFIKIKK